MSYIEKVLLPEERILYVANLHWVIYVRGLVVTIFGGLLGHYSYPIITHLFGANAPEPFGKILSGISLFLTIIGVALLASAYVRQTSTELALTTRRIIAKYGFISRSTFEIVMSRVTGANFDQTVMGRILGYGTILVHGAGGETSPIDLVTNPQMFHRALLQAIQTTSAR